MHTENICISVPLFYNETITGVTGKTQNLTRTAIVIIIMQIIEVPFFQYYHTCKCISSSRFQALNAINKQKS